ncbi:MAG: ABC transporter ATP-binding protein [Cellulosilyticaceae bacterium]
MDSLKWIWGYLKKYRYKYGFALVIVLITSFLGMINPFLGGEIIDQVLMGGKTDMLLPILGLMMGIVLVKCSITYGYQMIFEKVSQNILLKIRDELYCKLSELDVDYYKQHATGDIMARMTGDTDLLRHFIAWVVYNIVANISIFIFAVVSMLLVNVELTLIMVSICPFIAYFTIKMGKEIGPTFHGIRNAYSRLNALVQENISGNRVVKAFLREDYEIEKFAQKNQDYKEANVKSIAVAAKYIPVLEFIANSLSVVMLLGGGILVIKGRMTLGDLAIFNGLLWALNNPMRMAGYLINDTQRFIASSEKIREILGTETKIKNVDDVADVRKIKGDITFKNVSFSYENVDAIKNVSFEAKRGQTIGIIGHTGAGKSTLTNLMGHFYEPVSGQILVDGIDIRRIDLKTLRESISIAMQDIFLFSDTIKANIAYGVPDASKEQIKEIAAMAEAHEFIREMPDGYETVVGERGVGLSGGQRQRIALARALLKKPSILILDDTTSALDMETEFKIQQEVIRKDKRYTTFIIAHKIASVKEADMILVMENGRIVESGTHDALVANGGKYYEVYKTQFGTFKEEGK